VSSAAITRLRPAVARADGPPPLVSVVIPCFNSGRFLGEAIESALGQTHQPTEVIVVDDGSMDDTAQVARRYAEIRYIRQANAGVAAARNAGLHASRGALIVFLDADDRLLPGAVEIGVDYLRRWPGLAFVSGHYRDIDAAGRTTAEWPHRCVESDHYLALLREPYIAMQATVTFRREPLVEAGGYEQTLRGCEDYDLYLRLSRQYPVGCHCALTAEYRQHSHNTTRDPELMLRSAMSVVRRQRAHACTTPAGCRAFSESVQFWRQYYGPQLAHDLIAALSERRWRQAGRDAVTLAREDPQAAAGCARQITGYALLALLRAPSRLVRPRSRSEGRV